MDTPEESYKRTAAANIKSQVRPLDRFGNKSTVCVRTRKLCPSKIKFVMSRSLPKHHQELALQLNTGFALWVPKSVLSKPAGKCQVTTFLTPP